MKDNRHNEGLEEIESLHNLHINNPPPQPTAEEKVKAPHANKMLSFTKCHCGRPTIQQATGNCAMHYKPQVRKGG